MKRRILSILMCLCMTLCLLPTAALADGVTEYDIWVGGIRVTSENAGSVTGPGITGTVNYNAESNTLTLSGVSVTGAYADSNSHSAAIYASTSTALTVVLTGVNTAVGPYTANACSFGVYCSSALTINGTGSLNAVGGTEKGTYCASFGIFSNNSVTISGNVTVTATGGTASGNSCGMDGEHGISISDATVTAAGGMAGETSCGVWGSCANVGVSISGSAKVTATGGKAVSHSFGVYGGYSVVDVSVSGTATVTATGGEAGNYSCGVWGSDIVSVSGGSLTATGGKATVKSYGIYSSFKTISVNNESDGTSNDSLLIAKGESSATNTTVACGADSALLTGAYAEDFAVWGVTDTYTVLNSTLDLSTWPDSDDSTHWNDTTGGCKTETVEGVKTLTLKNVIINAPDAADSDAYGIKLPNEAVNLVLEGINVVSAGNTPAGASSGVYGDGSINISGEGALYTLAGSATDSSYGVYGFDISVFGGATVTAIAGSAMHGSIGVNGSNISVFGSATVTAIAGSADVSIGVFGGNIAVETTSVLTAIAGSATIGSIGVYSSGVTLSGTVTAIGGMVSSSGNNSYGVYGESVTVEATGVLTAMGGAIDDDSEFSCGVYGESVTVEAAGVLTAMGGTASGSMSHSYGVCINSVTVEAAGVLTATGGTANGDSGSSCGVYSVSGTATLSGTVAATGGTASGDSGSSYGVYSRRTISVTSGTATALSGTVGSCGSSQAMSPPPDYSGYTDVGVVASANADGSSPEASYDPVNITHYKYLKIGTLYTLTVNLDDGSGTTATGNHMAGDAVPINAGTKPGYTFSGWTATGGGTFASASSAATTYTMPTGAAAITATWTANPNCSDRSTAVPVSSGSGTVSLSASISGATATVSATDAQLKKIASGTQTGTVKLDASGLKVDTVVVPSKLVTAAIDASGSAGLEVALPAGTVTLDKAALASVSGKGDVRLSVETVDNSKLTDTQKDALGNQADSATVVDVNLYAGGSRVSTFGNGTLQVSVPYTLKSGENADRITVWFINDDGTIEPKSGVYNAATGCVEFTTEHLSQYLIVSFPFADVAENSWYYGSVAYAYNNGLFAGTSDTAFRPGTTMTRQMIWMVLARMDGRTPADMEAARTWAMENGISDGSAPTSSITREQMAAILYRYAQYKSYDTTQGGMAIREFTDYDSVSEYALPALAWTVNAGLMQGSNNNLMPTSSATRAQVATILQRFCRNVAEGA